jgi:hypothetical protein
MAEEAPVAEVQATEKTQEEIDAEELEAMMAEAGNSIAEFEATREAEVQQDKAAADEEMAERRAADDAKKAGQQAAIEKEQRKRMKTKRAERRKENALLGVVEPELESDSASEAEDISNSEEEDDGDEAGAVTKIQAMRRGRASRRELEEQKAAALKIQALTRGKKGRARSKEATAAAAALAQAEAAAAKAEELQTAAEEAAAAASEASKLEAEEASAALKIQAMQRGKLSRKEQEELKKDQVRGCSAIAPPIPIAIRTNLLYITQRGAGRDAGAVPSCRRTRRRPR